MVTHLSPGIITREFDLTTTVQGVSSSSAAFVGDFQWGPLEQIITIDSEVELVDTFFKPDSNTYIDFLVCSDFLTYSQNLKVVRVANTTAAVNATGDGTGVLIKNLETYDEDYLDGSGSVGTFAARYAGDIGNSLRVSVCPSSNAFSSTMAANVTTTNGSATITFGANVHTDAVRPLVVGDYIKIGTLGNAVVQSIEANGLMATVNSASMITANLSGNTALVTWKYKDEFDSAPGTSSYATNRNGSGDEMHVIVLDEDGRFSGVANTVLEKFPFVSKASDARNEDGTTLYYRDVIREKSKYVYWMDHMTGGTNWGSSASATTFTNVNNPEYTSLSGGIYASATDANRTAGWDKFANEEKVDVSLLIAGNASSTVVTYVISNVAETRQDCVLFFSPEKADVVNNDGSEADDVKNFRNNFTSTSYAFMDSNWKRRFDKYNNVYRWIPCNGDTAGLTARTDFTNDPWWSPAGLNRGHLRNSWGLAWSPSKTDRDELYKVGVNPVVHFDGEGDVLYGNKTLLSKPSAFDRLNVRRLFIVLRKAISKAAKYSLFEFNDSFTRARLINLIEPYLRDVKGRRGIYDFRVICDESNNPGSVIDRNELVCDIYIKPTRTAEFITLNFVAVGSEVSFNTIIGSTQF